MLKQATMRASHIGAWLLGCLEDDVAFGALTDLQRQPMYTSKRKPPNNGHCVVASNSGIKKRMRADRRGLVGFVPVKPLSLQRQRVYLSPRMRRGHELSSFLLELARRRKLSDRALREFRNNPDLGWGGYYG